MPKTVDLRQKPYQLDDQQVALVEDTLAGLSDEEKIGQLFVNLFFFGEDAFRSNQLSNKYILANYHIGGAR
ncbi:beta-N-acetylhexosaminidase [Streptococcus pyogenes]|nr:beta-N-acetylhexosaminidase [Streptococcus pyogenes]VGR46707.1 beta-N-acetylhexosaminidase [Streptococcus pyogenes]VGT46592.1 beta-N-acetylhexosaminidase [Streptococcus pyogenes]VGY81901.1 beta-N-acetylhexosaminidase [Streptococcus pyogenes]VGZ02727.1 beta-N-acetylhexosaminidase [Streptococcus pyogenes]